MLEILNKLTQFSEAATRRLRVRSALNPILWLCAISMPLCFAAAYLFRDNAIVADALLLFGCCPLLVACATFVGFAIFSPEKLQSEEYQIRHESLQLIQQKSGRLSVLPASITAIANPEHALLPQGDDSRA